MNFRIDATMVVDANKAGNKVVIVAKDGKGKEIIA